MVETMGIKLLHGSALDGITSLPNFMKIYHVVQKISRHDLHLKTATPLGRLCPTIHN
jgi:hypothetical protein